MNAFQNIPENYIKANTYADLPTSVAVGTIGVTKDTQDIYVFDGTTWQLKGAGAGAGITQLTGDVTATGPGVAVATVVSVGGKTAAQIATSVNDTQAATATNTPNTIVKRDAGGDFAASDVSVSSIIFRDTGVNTVTVKAPTTVTSSYTLNWPVAQGSTNTFLHDDGAGNLTWEFPTISGAATLTNANIWIGNASNVATEHTISGDISLSNTGVTAYVGVVPISKGGTGQITASAAFNALSPMTTLGDTIYGGVAGAGTRLGIGTSGQVLTVAAGIPSWATPTTGTVTSVTAGTGLNVGAGPGGTITSTGTLNLADTAVVAGSYGSASQVGTFTVDAQGRLTAALNVSIAISAAAITSGTLAIARGGTNNSTAYTAGSVIFSNGTSLTEDNSKFYWDDTNFALGIGMIPTAATFIDAQNTSGASKTLQLTGYGTGSTVGTRGRFARGTVGTPTATQSGDVINFWSARGYGASQFAVTSTGAINATAGENFTNTSNRTYLAFLTTPTASVTATENMRIDSTGITLGPQSSSTAIHQVNGGIYYTVRTITASLTLDTTTKDYIVLCNNSGAINITLPPPVVGRTFIIKDIAGTAGTNNITLVRNASEQIEGLAASRILQTNWGSWTVWSNGTNWFLA